RGKLKELGAGRTTLLHADGLAPLGEGFFDRIIVDGRLAAWPESLASSIALGGVMVCALEHDGAGRFATLHRSLAGEWEERFFEPVDLTPMAAGLAAAL